MHKNISICIFALFLFGACKPGEKDQLVESTVLQLPNGFDEFYTAFHQDSTFQKAHIVFPFTAKETMIDSVSRSTKDVIFEDDTWDTHQLITDPSFRRGYSVLGDMVTEIASDQMGLMSIERRWGKLDTSWYLIYYHTTNRSW